MNKDIITLYDDKNEKKDYKLLLVINKDYKYLIYTDINNMNLKNNIYAIKTKNLKSNEEVLTIDDNEWQMIEETYENIVNKM